VAVVIALALGYFGLDVSPSTVDTVIGQLESLQSDQVDQSQQPVEFRGDDDYEVFASKVLGSSDELWTGIFALNDKQYQKPRLVLFRDITRSSCGVASSRVGPHYCPADATIYLDETFFEELRRRYGGSSGEVAQAYVIAHEVGHHVQNQLGALQAGSQLSQDDSIALELQADCYAGVWAFSQAKNNVFENGEIEQAMSAAAAVGDDTIQEAVEGRVTPENWTHGSSEQRVAAFTLGYETGNPERCQL
jgi:predicted metalloprotease